MTFDFGKKGKVKINMIKNVKRMVKDFKLKYKMDGTTDNAASPDLFKIGCGELLDKEQKEDFHTFVAKGLFCGKRVKPDIQLPIGVLITRVHEPNKDDWQKLVRIMKFLNGTLDNKMTISIDDINTVKWYIDTSFAVHQDFKSHTGAIMTMGKGALQNGLSKQKLNTRSSCEAELVGADNYATKVLWTKLFIEAQSYSIKKNIVY